MTQKRNGLRAWVALQNEAIDIERIDIGLPMLPEALDGYCFVILSDLHIRRPGPYHGRILEAVRSQHPDCILIAGDTIDAGTERMAALDDFFVSLGRIAPCVAILGNNDCLRSRVDALRDMYRRTGVTLLENETRMISARGYPVRITGMLDPHARRVGVEPKRDREREEHVSLSSVLPPEEAPSVVQASKHAMLPSLLMVHRPELAAQYAELKPSLIVAGHAHGGQVRLPRIGGLYAPGQGFFPRLTSGVYPLGDSLLVVSRGLGNHNFPVRIHNPPHLPALRLRRA